MDFLWFEEDRYQQGASQAHYEKTLRATVPKEQLALEEAVTQAVAKDGNETSVQLQGMEECLHERLDCAERDMRKLVSKVEQNMQPRPDQIQMMVELSKQNVTTLNAMLGKARIVCKGPKIEKAKCLVSSLPDHKLQALLAETSEAPSPSGSATPAPTAPHVGTTIASAVAPANSAAAAAVPADSFARSSATPEIHAAASAVPATNLGLRKRHLPQASAAETDAGPRKQRTKPCCRMATPPAGAKRHRFEGSDDQLAVHPPEALVVNTDCSRMEAPVQALENLGVRFKHGFSSEKDKVARETLKANFNPQKLYGDLKQRGNAHAMGCDLYVAGFPCQPFSGNGKLQGVRDPRGTIIFYILKYLQMHTPKVVLLENVKKLATKFKETFDDITSRLVALGYNVYHKVLDTKDHGVPQNRPRVYIVCIRKDVDKGTFTFPEPISCPSIELFLDARAGAPTAACVPTGTRAQENLAKRCHAIEQRGGAPLQEPWVMTIDYSRKRGEGKAAPRSAGVCPCLVHGEPRGHWVSNRGRRTNLREMFRLQGMDPRRVKMVVSPNQMGAQLGNTMSVNVLERILCRLLPAAGLTEGGLADRWESGAAVEELAVTRA